ncbi:MAG: ribonuclease Y [Planctomycetota bacterium]|nr:ribonuclease Y [Planctomycetota bacterium]
MQHSWLTLAAMEPLDWAIAGGVAAVAVIVALLLQRTISTQTLARAKSEAEQILRRAEAEGRTATERAEVEAKRRTLADREKFEAELQGQREELRELERRLAKREDAHERQVETLAQREAEHTRSAERLRERETAAARREAELTDLIDRQKSELMRVAGMSMEEARQVLLTKIEEDVRHDAGHIVRKITEEAQAEAKEKAREITLMAVQRFAAEHVSESTVRSIPIPSDDMKGRIIGREGRNIRAIEKATGVDIIVDDTPGVIVVSCFDKVRQTVAAEALMKLIQDGRIHPSRVEEVVEQVRKEMDERILKYGKDSVLEVNLRSIHPKVSEAMGRLHFRTSYGQNVLRHSIEVGFLCQMIADQLGLNGTIARRCGFLHDIGKAMDQDMEGTHPKIGYDFAKQHGEKEPVLNAILGHHGDVPATSFYTPIVMAADAISGARPGARRESLEKYIQRLEQLQAIAMEQPGVDEAHAIQAGREVRVMVDAKRISDDEAFLVAKRIADRVSAEMTFPGEIKVTVLRETRAVEVAR